MKKVSIISIIAIFLASFVISCTEDNFDSSEPEVKADNAEAQYIVQYTEQQLENWKNTGSPFLDDELENSFNTIVDPTLPVQGGVFKPIETPQTKAWGVNPQQNRFWAMIRLKLSIPNQNWKLKAIVIEAISKMEEQTNVRFFNAINDPDTDPTWGFKYPNVHIHVTKDKKKGSSYVGRKGDEQYIYVPEDATVEFIMRALCNVAGMYNEQQRSDRDTYVNVTTANVAPENRYHFDKITKNYYGMGGFDMESITLAGTFQYSSSPNLKSIVKKNDATIVPADELSSLDKQFLNYFYLPYTARSDVYRELDKRVYKSDNTLMTESERLQLQAKLNNGNPNPPSGGRLTPVDW